MTAPTISRPTMQSEDEFSVPTDEIQPITFVLSKETIGALAADKKISMCHLTDTYTSFSGTCAAPICSDTCQTPCC
jgi:hypothetical protein